MIDKPNEANGASMVRLTIDGELVEVPAGTTIMKAARSANLSVPRKCTGWPSIEAKKCRSAGISPKSL